MERKRKGLSCWSFAKMQPKWHCFEELNLATFLTNSSISSWLTSVWQEQKQTFLRVYVFFFSWRRLCCPYTETYSRDSSKRHHTTYGRGLQSFARNFTSLHDRFHPLNFYFLFAKSSFSHSLGPLRTSCGLNIVGIGPFTTFLIALKVLPMSLALRTYVQVRGTLKIRQLTGKKCSIFSKLFFTRKIEKVRVCTNKWHNTSTSSVLLSKLVCCAGGRGF